MARMNIDIFEISELKWTGMGEFNSDDHYIYYCGLESLRINGVSIIVNKRVHNDVLGCNLTNAKNDLCTFPRKTIQITIIKDLTSNAGEAEIEWFYEDLKDLLDLTSKRCPYRGLECKSGESRDIWRNREIWPLSIK